MAKSGSKGDVQWTLPSRKRPFAYSTTATSDLIVMLGQDRHTVASAAGAILYDPEGKAILRELPEAGYADTPLRELVRA
jgi:hypothetical protein